MNYDFWRGRRVFLTGHTGFKGTWLSLWLQHLGAVVTGYSLRPDQFPCMFEVVDASDGMKSVVGDVRDRAALTRVLCRARPEIVFHLAAQPLVRRSYAEPIETFEVNVMGTVNVLEACRQCESVRAAVMVTTDKCYENREWTWGYREDDPMGGHDPYSASKGCAELAATAYRRSFFTNGTATHHALVATARAGNVIGGGDWSQDRLIPDMIRSFHEGQPVIIRSPASTRPWQDVLEPLSGYLLLAEKLFSEGETYAGGWNFGPEADDSKPVSWIVDHLSELWGDGAAWELDGREQPHEARELRLDIGKAQRVLGWRPRLSLPQTLERLVAWYRAYYGGTRDMRRLTVHQIESFMAIGQTVRNWMTGLFMAACIA